MKATSLPHCNCEIKGEYPLWPRILSRSGGEIFKKIGYPDFYRKLGWISHVRFFGTIKNWDIVFPANLVKKQRRRREIWGITRPSASRWFSRSWRWDGLEVASPSITGHYPWWVDDYSNLNRILTMKIWGYEWIYLILVGGLEHFYFSIYWK